MLTSQQIAEAVKRPAALDALPTALRREIDQLLLDGAQPVQKIFDDHNLAARGLSRATFYRRAQKLRLIQSAADFDDLIGPDGPPRETLFRGLQNGLLYQLAELVNAEEIEPGKIQKLAQSLKSLVTTDLALQKLAAQPSAPVRTPSASAGRENQQQRTAHDNSPSAHDDPPLMPLPKTIRNPRSTIHNPVQRPPMPPRHPTKQSIRNPKSTIRNAVSFPPRAQPNKKSRSRRTPRPRTSK